jgi:hypothetical protein
MKLLGWSTSVPERIVLKTEGEKTTKGKMMQVQVSLLVADSTAKEVEPSSNLVRRPLNRKERTYYREEEAEELQCAPRRRCWKL